MRIAIASVVAHLLIGCGDTGREATQRESEVPPPQPASSAQPGIRFDPATLRRGDSVGVLVVDSIAAQRNSIDSTYVGMARFRGQIELNGHTIEHPDSDVRAVTTCFEADSASAARLPRWQHDERRPWFCFTNRDDALRMLGTDGNATIVIDSFTIHRGLTDQVNSAHLARVGERTGGD